MSISKPYMHPYPIKENQRYEHPYPMHTAPPILGSMEFAGMQNEIILIEHDDDDCFFSLTYTALKDCNKLIFTGDIDATGGPYHNYAMYPVSSVSKIYTILKALEHPVDNIIIHAIDRMNLSLDKRKRGSLVASTIAMLASKKVLKGANLIISSCKEEHKLREMSAHYVSLRKPRQ